MNEPMDVQTQLLEWLKNAVEQGAVFIQAEAPQLVSEVIAWHFWSNAISAVGCVVGIAILLGITARCTMPAWRYLSGTGNEPALIFPVFFAVAAVIGLSICFCMSVKESIKAVVAPRLVIIEEVKWLVK